MSRRRVLEVELDGYGSLVRGHGSRELVIDVTGRAPVWSSVRRGWSVQEHTARDVVAAAEARFYDIVIAGPRAGLSTRAIAPVVGVTHPTVIADRRAGGNPLPPAPQTPEPVEEGEADAGSGQTPQGEGAPSQGATDDGGWLW